MLLQKNVRERRHGVDKRGSLEGIQVQLPGLREDGAGMGGPGMGSRTTAGATRSSRVMKSLAWLALQDR